MADKFNYRTIIKTLKDRLRDLKDQQRDLSVAIETLERLAASETREKSRVSDTPVIPIASNGHDAGALTMLDASYEILKAEGKKLHAAVIAQRLNENYGKTTHQNSVAARLPQDKDKRFKNIGQNTWELSEWTSRK